MSARPATPLESAVWTLTDHLKADPDLWLAYKANIAMAFVDEMRASLHNTEDYLYLHKKANAAAERFLRLLCYNTSTAPELEEEK